MAKKDAEAHKRHTKNGDAYLDRLAAKVAGMTDEQRARLGLSQPGQSAAVMRERMRQHADIINNPDRELLRTLEKLEWCVEPLVDSHDKRRFLAAVLCARVAHERGDGARAALEASRATALASDLCMAKPTQDGLKAKRNLESNRSAKRDKWPEYQKTLDAVRRERPDLNPTGAKLETAERCGASYRTILRRCK